LAWPCCSRPRSKRDSRSTRGSRPRTARSFNGGFPSRPGEAACRSLAPNNIIKEKSFVLILLYPFDSYSKSSQRIQRIRDLYKELFKQQSVLRVDDPYTVWVSF
jgi:hypothetical protein